MKKIIFTMLFLSTQLMSEGISWSYPPDSLSTINVNASDPQVGIDANGNTISVWVENGVVKSKSKPYNGSWGAIETVSNPMATSSSPRVVSDGFGNATAVWLEGTVIKGATRPQNGVWGSATSLSTSNASSPCIAIDAAGDVIAAWVRSNAIEASVKLFGMNWKPRTTVGNNGAANPRIAMGGNSAVRAAVVWDGVSNGVRVVYASTRLLSGSWGNQRVLSDVTQSAAYPDVAIDAQGNITAVWFSYTVENSLYSNVAVSSATNRAIDNTWQTAVVLSDPGNRNPATLVARVSYDGMGNAIALWNNSFNDMIFSVQSAIQPVNMDWNAPIDLIKNDLYGYSQGLSVAAIGDAIAVYMFYNGAAQIIQSTELDITGFMNSIWAVPLNISAGTQNAYPMLVSTVTGNAIQTAAVWISSNGMHNSVSASTGFKALIAPPSNLSVVQNTNNFGVFTEQYNLLTWTASPDSAVVGYLIYRNGQFLAQVDASVLQFVDDNRLSGGLDVYEVASVDDQQSHSIIRTVAYP